MHLYRCAICGRDCPYERTLPDAYPFCSSRCRLVDLGNWLNESYAIDRDLAPEELISRRDGKDDLRHGDGASERASTHFVE